MIFLRYSETYLEANTYVLADDEARQALVVDTGAGSHDWIKQALADRNLALGAVLLTHGHADHVWDVAAVAGEAPVYLPKPDMYRMENPIGMSPADPTRDLVLSRLGFQPWTTPKDLRELPSKMLEESYEIVEGIHIRAVPAPGHTEGSTVFLLGADPTPDREGAMMSTGQTEQIMLSGDVLFNNGVGRTDLAGGDPEKMAATLRLLVQIIKPETYVFPGHGPFTTMGREVRHNAYLHHAMR